MQVSVDTACEALITPGMIGDTSLCEEGGFKVYILNGTDTVPDALVTDEYLNQTLTAKLYDTVTGQNCWAEILVQDKLPPQISCNCPPVDTPDEAEDECIMNCLEGFENLEPTVTENCGDYELFLIDQKDEPLCHSDYIKKRTVYWVAIDDAGNVSDTCEQVMFLERIDFDLIEWPDSLTVENGGAFNCVGPFLDEDEDNCPDPGLITALGAGVPTINNVAIWPDFISACNAMIDYEDLVIEIGCGKKIMRMWTAYEWHCEGENDTLYTQLIEVVDETGPELECPEHITLTTGQTQCQASVHIPRPLAEDDCNDVNEISVTYPGGFAQDVPIGGIYRDFPAGIHIVKYTARDECHNATTCTWIVTVEDNTPPVAVCDHHTVVSLTNNDDYGLTLVRADVFDDGSYDECGDVEFTVSRMSSCIDFDWTQDGAFEGEYDIPGDGVNSNDAGTAEHPGVPFACCDVGADEPIMIIMRVTDESGNTNTCMVEVEVQDKIRPVIECPADIMVSCNYDIDFNDLSDFGAVVTDPELREEICLFDPANPDAILGQTCWGLDGYALDNCGVDVSEGNSAYLNDCGTGYILRTFTVTDPGLLTSSCQQRIDVVNFDPYEPDEHTFPNDTVIIGCGSATDPETTGNIEIDDDECDLIGYTYDDLRFDFVDGACFKILRTWQIIDWCQFGDGQLTQTGIWTHQQVIKVIDNAPPSFTTDQDPIDVCNEFDCEDTFVELIQQGNDDCTPAEELFWTYSIDANNDNTVDITHSGSGGTIDASGTYPIGDHRVIYSFEDRCGNQTVVEQLFSVDACKPPTPICLAGLSADLMPVDLDEDGVADWGMVRLWATDFDNKSAHDCDIPVVLSFSSDTTDQYMDFDCSHVGVGPVAVQLWVTDVERGNQAYCETFIIIQDNMNACQDTTILTGGGVVSGLIETEDHETVLDVRVDMGAFDAMTNAMGEYVFPSMPGGGSYTVQPVKNDDWRNGVSTLDLVRIQKHLLGMQPFESPYRMIAADANNSGSISAIDLVLLRKLILGISQEIAGNTSWRFVDHNYQFTTPSNPFGEAFPESYTITGLAGDMNIDFVAIKTGDVNNTVQANFNAVNTEMASGLTMGVQDKVVKAGERFEMTFAANEAAKTLGYQFTLNFNGQLFEYVGLEAGALDISDENFGLHQVKQGVISTSWSDGVATKLDENEVLFTLAFVAKADARLSENFWMSSDMTRAESYNEAGQIGQVELEFSEDVFAQSQAAEFALMQNTPNPFSDQTVIAFTLPEADATTITVYDVTGRTLHQNQMDASAGYNEYMIEGSVLEVSGVLYYSVKSGDFSATRKMIRMN